MSIELRYNTADQEVPLGYFLDSTDGDTEETGLTIANTDIKLWKWGATTLANKNSGGGAHISNGIYYAIFDATDTNTLGPMKVFVHKSGALAFELEVNVVAQHYWDAKYGTGKMQADVQQWKGAGAPDNTGDAFSRLGAPAGASIAADLLTIDNLVDDIESRLTAARAGYLDNLSGGAVALEATLTAIKGGGWSTETLVALKDLVDDLETRLTAARAGYLDELASANIPADVDTLLVRLSALRAGYLDNLSAGATALEATLTAIKGGGWTTQTLVSINSLVDDLETRLTAIRAANLDELGAANIPADIDTLLARLSALRAGYLDNLSGGAAALEATAQSILTDTNELQTDLHDGGRLDLLIDAIKAKTDGLPSGLAYGEALANFEFVMIDSTDNKTPKTGLTVSGQISKDGGAFAALTNTVTEVGSGVYKVTLTTTERQAYISTLIFTATGANATIITIASS